MSLPPHTLLLTDLLLLIPRLSLKKKKYSTPALHIIHLHYTSSTLHPCWGGHIIHLHYTSLTTLTVFIHAAYITSHTQLDLALREGPQLTIIN